MLAQQLAFFKGRKLNPEVPKVVVQNLHSRKKQKCDLNPFSRESESQSKSNPKTIQMFKLLEKHFNIDILHMFKDLKESIAIMLEQMKIQPTTEAKKKNRNSRTKNHNA